MLLQVHHAEVLSFLPREPTHTPFLATPLVHNSLLSIVQNTGHQKDSRKLSTQALPTWSLAWFGRQEAEGRC